MAITPEQILSKVMGKSVRSTRHFCFEVSRTLQPKEAFLLAQQLYALDDVYAAMAAAFMAGHVSYILDGALEFLRSDIARHPDVRVQDALARAFDHFCLNRGWERAMPIMREWGQDRNEVVRRAMIEAPRPWTRKDWFAAHPKKAIEAISILRADPSGTVRFSVGRGLAEVSQDFPDEVLEEIKGWNTRDPAIKHTYMYAARHIQSRIGGVF